MLELRSFLQAGWCAKEYSNPQGILEVNSNTIERVSHDAQGLVQGVLAAI